MSNISILRPKGYESWHPIPEWACWTAVDSDGTAVAYEARPYIPYGNPRQWVPPKGKFQVIGLNRSLRDPLWMRSLTAVKAETQQVPTHAQWQHGKARQQLRRVIGIGCVLLAGVLWYVVAGSV